MLAPDCISSSAYGTEQMLTQMTPYIGLAAFSLLVPITVVILGVLFVVTMSYLDVIGFYTSAGGSYVVARDNFGPKVAQIAAVALLIDYSVTVAVQSAAGTDALASAFPRLNGYVLPITVAIVLLLIFGNLRGIREAGKMFALPTYFYVLLLGSTMLVGYVKFFGGTLPVIPTPPPSRAVRRRARLPGLRADLRPRVHLAAPRLRERRVVAHGPRGDLERRRVVPPAPGPQRPRDARRHELDPRVPRAVDDADGQVDARASVA